MVMLVTMILFILGRPRTLVLLLLLKLEFHLVWVDFTALQRHQELEDLLVIRRTLILDYSELLRFTFFLSLLLREIYSIFMLMELILRPMMKLELDHSLDSQALQIRLLSNLQLMNLNRESSPLLVNSLRSLVRAITLVLELSLDIPAQLRQDFLEMDLVNSLILKDKLKRNSHSLKLDLELLVDLMVLQNPSPSPTMKILDLVLVMERIMDSSMSLYIMLTNPQVSLDSLVLLLVLLPVKLSLSMEEV